MAIYMIPRWMDGWMTIVWFETKYLSKELGRSTESNVLWITDDDDDDDDDNVLKTVYVFENYRYGQEKH